MLTGTSTGSTGYIGGTVLNKLYHHDPDYSITVLLRSTPAHFEAQYPRIRIVNGDFDSVAILEDEAAKADVVIREHDIGGRLAAMS